MLITIISSLEEHEDNDEYAKKNNNKYLRYFETLTPVKLVCSFAGNPFFAQISFSIKSTGIDGARNIVGVRRQ